MEAYEIEETLQLLGIEEFNRYYGVYRAQVTDNKDPEFRGRVQVKVPIMGHQNPLTVWIDPSYVGAGANRGMFWAPEIGDPVRVTFDRGDSGQPILYISGWYGKNYLPEELGYSASGRPEKKGFVTRLGHKLIFNDVPNEEAVELVCHFPDSADKSLTENSVLSADRSLGTSAQLSFNKDSISIVNQNNASITIDATNNLISIIDENNNSIVLDEEGIKITDTNNQIITFTKNGITIEARKNINISAKFVTVDAGSISLGKNANFSNVLGEKLISYLASHVHPLLGPVPGGPALVGSPTGPPLIPPLSNLLSHNVKTS